jgi:hypothetical protein
MTKSELLKVIRAHCLDCCCDQPSEVTRCGCPSCKLYPYRFGKDPTPRVLSSAQLEALEKMRAHRAEKSRIL